MSEFIVQIVFRIVREIAEFFLVLIPFFYPDPPQRDEKIESLRKTQRKIIVISAVATVLLFFSVFLTDQLGLVTALFLSTLPFVLVIAFVGYRWKYRRDVPTITVMMIWTFSIVMIWLLLALSIL